MSIRESYEKLITSYKKAYPSGKNPSKNIQSEVNEIWDEVRKKKNVVEEVEQLTLKYDSIFKSRTSGIYRFLAMSSNNTQENSTSSSTSTTTTTSIASTTSSITSSLLTFNKQYPKRAQEELIKNLDFVNHNLGGLYKRKAAGMLSEIEEKVMKENEVKKNKIQKELKKKIDEQRRSKQSRERKKLKNNDQQSDKVVQKSGRPPIEDDQPGLLSAIIESAKTGYSAADTQRSSDIYRSIKTLDDLKEALHKQGFVLSCIEVHYT